MVEITGITISDTVLVALVSGLIGFLPTFLATYVKFRKDLEASYDKDLRGRRIEVYRSLWKLLEPLARYAPPEPITPQILDKLMKDIEGWYFGTGGLFLSDDSRNYYFTLMNDLQKVAKKPLEYGSEKKFDVMCGIIIKRGSDLRQSLCKDVGSRKKPILK